MGARRELDTGMWDEKKRKLEEDRMYLRKSVCRLKEMQEFEFLEAQQKDADNNRKLLAEESEKKRQEVLLQEEQKRRQDEEQRLQQSKEHERQLKIASIQPEPPSTDPNACEIAFRLPSGKRIVRRFLKSCRVEVPFTSHRIDPLQLCG